jgi:large subunit ribosomal protein L21
MYAIIKTGGKQYRVVTGDVIEIELLDAEPGAHIEFKDVLFFHDGSASQIGAPTIPNFIVAGEVIGAATGPKITSVKYKPSHTQCRKFGHRQKYLKVKITALGHHEEHKQRGSKHGT